MTTNQHWTERSIDDFVSRITFDFTTQIEQAVGSQAELARSLGVSKGRVSQILSSHSISLKNIVKHARAIGKKVAIVLYDDSDPKNTNGPVNSQIFSTCWERAGKPADFFDLEATTAIGESVLFQTKIKFWMLDQNSQSVLTRFNEGSWGASSGYSQIAGRAAQNDEAVLLEHASHSATTANQPVIH